MLLRWLAGPHQSLRVHQRCVRWTSLYYLLLVFLSFCSWVSSLLIFPSIPAQVLSLHIYASMGSATTYSILNWNRWALLSTPLSVFSTNTTVVLSFSCANPSAWRLLAHFLSCFLSWRLTSCLIRWASLFWFVWCLQINWPFVTRQPVFTHGKQLHCLYSHHQSLEDSSMSHFGWCDLQSHLALQLRSISRCVRASSLAHRAGMMLAVPWSTGQPAWRNSHSFTAQ